MDLEQRIERLLAQNERLQERLCAIFEQCERHLWVASVAAMVHANPRQDELAETVALVQRLRRGEGEGK